MILYLPILIVSNKCKCFFQHLARLEEAQSWCQTLHADGETLKRKLDDKEKMTDILRLQMESSAQMTVQHNRTIDNLHKENSLLSNQLNQHKVEIQQLRVRSKAQNFTITKLPDPTFIIVNVLLFVSVLSSFVKCGLGWVRPAQVRPGCCGQREAAAAGLCGWTKSACPGGNSGETAA